ncbi:CLUMA_CG002466, isoform A [Clunio marinus]|uniref:CLUMA_CG002466, isoform A n=1 Tax=Clunio marinus TaxID=568069 RepID=A0A1J1HKR2_9DIPT|nr:CLUMA_CG002466, isoform A [Clunio marinus]
MIICTLFCTKYDIVSEVKTENIRKAVRENEKFSRSRFIQVEKLGTSLKMKFQQPVSGVMKI